MKRSLLLLSMFTTLLIVVQSKANASTTLNPISTIAKADSVAYTGKYKMAEGSPVEEVTVAVRGEKVFAQGGDYPESELVFKKDDEYEEPGLGAMFIFVRTDGKVTGLKILVQGMELVGTKL